MIRLIDPKALLPIEIGDTVFYVKQKTTGEKLAVADKIKDLNTESEKGFDQMMDIAADLILGIDGYVILKNPDIVGHENRILNTEHPTEMAEGERLPDNLPGHGLTVREFCRRIDNLTDQNNLVMLASQVDDLKIEEAKN